MKITKNTVVTLSMSVTDAQNNFIEQTSGDGFTYLHGGYDDFFPTIEEALEGQEIGFETTIQLEPEDAFGEYDAELVRVEDRSLFPPETEAGMMFEGIPEGGDEDEMEFFTVTDIAGDKVVLDGNHPLAGVALRCTVKVTDVRAATAEEIEHEHVHDGDDHHHDHDEHDTVH
ncbi:MAG: peptidylprolyl isomerase [Burkholderiales bacterium]|nr:peptidylprolyl isomerase [Burkholderiales bacterium]